MVVLDASAMVELLIESRFTNRIDSLLRNREIHVPSHFDAEVLSALGRLHRSGYLSESDASSGVNVLSTAYLERHPLPGLLRGAWARRGHIRLVDALYVQLAEQLDVPLITTDARLASVVSIAVHPDQTCQ